MTRSQAVAVGLNAANAGILFLLVTQQDVVIPPLIRVFLGLAGVVVGVVLTALKIVPAPTAIEVPGGDQPIGGK